MATTRSYGDLLNDYLPNEMLFEEMVKRDWFLQNVKKRQDWKGGPLKVPFKGAGASSVKFGGLTAENDIAESQYPVGSVTDYVEVWGSIALNQRDLLDHSGKIPESTFLKLLPDELERFMEYMKQVCSIALATGPHFATFTADGEADGEITVDKIDRFAVGQKVVLDDSGSAAGTYYVIAVNVNTNKITVSATRGGAAADVSGYATSESAKCYHDGLTAAGGSFTSIRSALLSAANGGSSSLHGISKLAWPHLQAVNIDGSSMSAANCLKLIFNGYNEVRKKAKGNANTVVMSYKHLGSVMKLIDLQKGAFSVTKQPSASQYGWTEIEVTSVKGVLKLVGIQEMDDDVIFYLDMNSFNFNSNGGIRKNKSPDGLEYYTVRATTGYKYITDLSLFGEMTYENVGHNGIMYGITAYSDAA